MLKTEELPSAGTDLCSGFYVISTLYNYLSNSIFKKLSIFSYRSANKSSLYIPSSNIFLKLFFTASTSSLYVIPYQVSLLRNTFTDILSCSSNSPINAGGRGRSISGSEVSALHRSFLPERVHSYPSRKDEGRHTHAQGDSRPGNAGGSA